MYLAYNYQRAALDTNTREKHPAEFAADVLTERFIYVNRITEH
jgi:hypothetical protein